MDLTFQVPMQYCSLQHQTLVPSSVTSTSGWCFRFGSVSSFFLELFLHWSPVAYWAPTDLGSSSFSILSFCLIILFVRFSRQEYWSGLPFPSPVDHILSELSTKTRPSWMALHGTAHSFTELDKAVAHVIRLVSFLWLWFSECRVQNEARQRLIEFCQENELVIANNLFQQHEKTLHMDITRWSTLKSDWLYSLQPKMEKLYTVSKSKTGSWLWLRSWIPYCQIQT